MERLMNGWHTILSEETLEEIGDRYTRNTSFGLSLIADGRVIWDRCGYYPWEGSPDGPFTYGQMINEAVRWGEPNIRMDGDDRFIWCVPVFVNNLAVAGLFSAGEADAGPAAVRSAAWELLTLAEERNLVNSALMGQNRSSATTSAKRAETIHLSKRLAYQNPRDIYLIEERRLLDAVRSGNIETAREIINKILVGVYNAGSSGFDVLKPLVLEMIVQMFRAAVEEGVEASELLGTDGVLLQEFLEVGDEYELSRWLSQWLELFVNVSFSPSSMVRSEPLTPGLLFMRSHFDRPLTRAQVARACGLSPGYFSTLLRQGTGASFSQLLNRFRIEHACSLLAGTDMSISDIAFSCGYNDHGYFTKVFRSVLGTTPGKFREKRGKQIE